MFRSFTIISMVIFIGYKTIYLTISNWHILFNKAKHSKLTFHFFKSCLTKKKEENICFSPRDFSNQNTSSSTNPTESSDSAQLTLITNVSRNQTINDDSVSFLFYSSIVQFFLCAFSFSCINFFIWYSGL